MTRGRGGTKASRCDHRAGPIDVAKTEGGHRARCLVCFSTGPVRPTPEEAVEALRGRGDRPP